MYEKKKFRWRSHFDISGVRVCESVSEASAPCAYYANYHTRTHTHTNCRC